MGPEPPLHAEHFQLPDQVNKTCKTRSLSLKVVAKQSEERRNEKKRKAESNESCSREQQQRGNRQQQQRESFIQNLEY
jgi:hypothetical protein